MTDEEAIDRMMSCASAYHCKREEACFVAVTRLNELLARSSVAAIPEPDPETVANYAPDWGTKKSGLERGVMDEQEFSLRYPTEPERLAREHWSYVEGILIAHKASSEVLFACRYHYITAFEHGYKHAMESVEAANRPFSERG